MLHCNVTVLLPHVYIASYIAIYIVTIAIYVAVYGN